MQVPSWTGTRTGFYELQFLFSPKVQHLVKFSIYQRFFRLTRRQYKPIKLNFGVAQHAIWFTLAFRIWSWWAKGVSIEAPKFKTGYAAMAILQIRGLRFILHEIPRKTFHWKSSMEIPWKIFHWIPSSINLGSVICRIATALYSAVSAAMLMSSF